MFSNHQHRNFLPCSISKLSMSGFLTLIWPWLWCWTANEMSFSTTPSPGFLADFFILLPLFRTSGSSLVWTLVVDCGGLAWPGSEYHRCWTWIPPSGWSYILLPARLFWEICVCQHQPIASYCQTSLRQDLRKLWTPPIPSSMSSYHYFSEYGRRHCQRGNCKATMACYDDEQSGRLKILWKLSSWVWWQARQLVEILWFFSSWVWLLPWSMK